MALRHLPQFQPFLKSHIIQDSCGQGLKTTLQSVFKKMPFVLSHFAIPVALCNKIVAFCNTCTCRTLIKKLSHFVINLKWMVGGQVNPGVFSSTKDNRNNNNKAYHMDRLPNEILSKIIYQVLISSNFSTAVAWGGPPRPPPNNFYRHV